jgi:competence ComEA-like helix-hairpin-helix protein
MSAFYKITLGIPISLNNESLEGLTAIPGIGPRIASAIVRERAKREGFQQMDEMLSIPGIGPTLYRKAARYLTL